MRKLLLILFIAVFGSAGLSSQEVIDLIVGYDQTKSLRRDEQSLPYKRIQAVELNPRLRSIGSNNINDKLMIGLFDDEVHPSTIDKVNVNVNGTLTIRARLDDHPMGYLILSITGDKVLGSVRIPERDERYSIRTATQSGDTWLKSIDTPRLDFIEDGPPLIPPGYPEFDQEQLKSLRMASELGPESYANIDVMIVYTPSAASWATNNEGSIQNTIAQSMAKAQLALDNSDTGMSVTLVHSAQVAYTESGSSNTDLNRLTFHQGFDPWSMEGYPRYLEEVHQWRDQYGADLVAIFANVDDTGGLGWLLTRKSGSSHYGFSLTRVQQASWTYTHIHEMGHNMGLHHHKCQNSYSGPTNWNDWQENSWSAGWRWVGDDNKTYVSLMSYSGGNYYEDGISATTAPYFSNPDVIFKGAPTGHATDADNARTLREIKHVIASYRAAIPEYSLTMSATGEGTVTFNGKLYTGSVFVKEGSTVNVRALPGTGQRFVRWTDQEDNMLSADRLYTFTMPSADLSISASFEPEDYNVAVNISPGGAGSATAAGTYNMNDEVTLGVIESEGYVFINWTDAFGKILSFDPAYSFTMPPSEVVVSANFRLTDILLFPNPVKGEFTILSSERMDEIRITSVTGRVVYTRSIGNNRASISTEGINNGIYIVSVHTVNGVFFERIMVVK